MKINTNDWKPFKVSDLFSIHNGKGITKEEIAENPGDFVAVQSGEENNGIMGLIDLEYCKSKGYTYSEKPCLTVARSGTAGFVSFQVHGCVVGDSAKILLLKKKDATIGHYLFLQTVLSAIRYKYAYGRKVTEAKYKNEIIKLPIINTNDGYVPDWQLMEDYIKSLHHKTITTQNKISSVPVLNVRDWKEFRFGDLITDIYKAKAINKDDLTIAEGDAFPIRYITRTGDNNGCELLADKAFIDVSFIEEGNAITIGDTTATCFYQSNEFITGDHMVVVRADPWLNQYTGLFIVAMLSNEQYKYSYGRAFLKEKIKDTIIKLPVDSRGIPDWQFMEDYIKSLPYGDRLNG